jgi:hypothetical protein
MWLFGAKARAKGHLQAAHLKAGDFLLCCYFARTAQPFACARCPGLNSLQIFAPLSNKCRRVLIIAGVMRPLAVCIDLPAEKSPRLLWMSEGNPSS